MNKRLYKVRKLYEGVSKNSPKKFYLKGSKINEDYQSNPVAIDEFNDLLDRAESNYDGDLEDAVRTAIDDGLIYTEDVLALMNRYMTASEISSVFFDNCEDALFTELSEALEDKISEREDTDESLNEGDTVESRKIEVKPGYHEWVLYVDDKPYYSYGDVGEEVDDFDSADEFAYEYADYVVNAIDYNQEDPYFLSELGKPFTEEEVEDLYDELKAVYNYYKSNESLKEAKDLDFVSDKFSQEMLSTVKDLLKDSSEEEALAKLDAKHEAGEIDDKKYEYIKNYFDTLKISAEEAENRGEGEKRRDLWDIVYDEVFGSKSSVDNFYKSAEDAPKKGEIYYEESDKYFDPSEVVKGFNSKKYDGIGIKNAKDIDRLKKIAEKFNLKYSVGSSGKSIIIMIPAEMADKSPVVYLKKLGLKQLKNLQK